MELGAFTAGSWVQFLVGELRSRKPRGVAPVPQKHLFRLLVVSQNKEGQGWMFRMILSLWGSGR